MKKITLFVLRNCPFCIQALEWQQGILKENKDYQKIPLEIVDEAEEYDRAEGYDYYYVPSYYIDDQKVHEGVATREKIEMVFEMALRD